MNKSQLRGVGIIVASLFCVLLSLQLGAFSVIIVPLIFSTVLLVYGILLFTQKVQLAPKSISFIDLGIGLCIGVILSMFVLSFKNNKETQRLRELETKFQSIKKHPK
ncbi:hypothetical protein HRH25_05845 [Flavisolibacter sp. BT320]|nr:hypothetical protein [Flavisolibacter longurius]